MVATEKKLERDNTSWLHRSFGRGGRRTASTEHGVADPVTNDTSCNRACHAAAHHAQHRGPAARGSSSSSRRRGRRVTCMNRWCGGGGGGCCCRLRWSLLWILSRCLRVLSRRNWSRGTLRHWGRHRGWRRCRSSGRLRRRGCRFLLCETHSSFRQTPFYCSRRQ